MTVEGLLAEIAPEGSDLRALVDVLFLRGCTLQLQTYADSHIRHILCTYPDGGAPQLHRVRLLYADGRAVDQIRNLLQHMNQWRST